MQQVGAILKAEREKKGLSLHEIGMSLKINPKILKAIEDNEEAQLPAKTFLRGFIRSYAQYLHLDVQNILAQLQKEIGSTRPEEILRKSEPESVAPKVGSQDIHPVRASTSARSPEKTTPLNEDLGLTGNKIISIVGTIVLILMIIFVARMVEKYQKESQHPTTEFSEAEKLKSPEIAPEVPQSASGNMGAEVAKEEPITPIEAPAPTEKSSVGIPTVSKPVPSHPATSSTPAASPSITPATTAPAAKAVQTPIAVAPTTKTPAAPPASSPATPAPAKVVQSPIVQPPAMPTTSTPVAPASNAVTPVEVIVEALDKVEIRYSFGNDKYETIALVADETHTFRSKTGVKFEISDGGALSIIVNGREKGVPGTIGKPVKLSYPK
jgi:cytoskeleton protein RodZ